MLCVLGGRYLLTGTTGPGGGGGQHLQRQTTLVLKSMSHGGKCHMKLIRLQTTIFDWWPQLWSQIVSVTTLDAENTTLLESCIHFYIFTNVSDMYTKYAT